MPSKLSACAVKDTAAGGFFGYLEMNLDFTHIRRLRHGQKRAAATEPRRKRYPLNL